MARPGKPPSNSIEERRGIQSVEISAAILTALAEATTAQSLKDISDAVGMTRTKAHRYLASFIRTGLVQQDPHTGLYDLGQSSLKLGVAALSRYDIIGQASAAIKNLSHDYNLTSYLSIWGPQGPTIIRWQSAQHTLVTSLNLGSVLPLLSSATGRIFLAFSSGALTDNIVAEELKTNRRMGDMPQQITTLADVEKLKDTIRTKKIASVDSSVIPGLRAIACPVLNMQGDAAAVIALIGRSYSLLDNDSEEATALKTVCQNLSVS